MTGRNIVLSILLFVVLTAFGCASAGYYHEDRHGYQGTSEQYREFQRFNKGPPEAWEAH
jgi:hypothetical protein